MKNLQMLMSLAAGATLFAVGCGAPPEETPAEQQPVAQPAPEQSGTVHAFTYQVCWPSLGVYAGPGTGYAKYGVLYHDLGDIFFEDSLPFSANGDYWIRGSGFSNAQSNSWYGYVRWDGLCHG